LKTENHKTTIKLEMGIPKLADTIYQALMPEVNISQKAGVKASISIDGSVLTLYVEAQSIARLRALLNSYLRWIATITNTIKDKTD
jgi:tRNA threonylcarbamoyladenosine modification (KEOPS) complex  Pcc1 subunit